MCSSLLLLLNRFSKLWRSFPSMLWFFLSLSFYFTFWSSFHSIPFRLYFLSIPTSLIHKALLVSLIYDSQALRLTSSSILTLPYTALWLVLTPFHLEAAPCYIPYHRSNSVSISIWDAPQMHSWSSNITSCMLPFSIWTISILAWVLWHPTICEITLTLSSALHLSTDSAQHMYTHPRSRITVTHRADTICSVFLVTCLSHYSTCYFLLFYMLFLNLPHARCPLLPVMFHPFSIHISFEYPSCISPVSNINSSSPSFLTLPQKSNLSIQNQGHICDGWHNTYIEA